MAHESPHRLIDLLPAIFRRSEELEAFLVPFEAASVLLLVVMIGAAYLARPEN